MTEARYITFLRGFAATIGAIMMAGDVKELLRAEIQASNSALLTEMVTYQMDIISKIAELDNRITRLER